MRALRMPFVAALAATKSRSNPWLPGADAPPAARSYGMPASARRAHSRAPNASATSAATVAACGAEGHAPAADHARHSAPAHAAGGATTAAASAAAGSVTRAGMRAADR